MPQLWIGTVHFFSISCKVSQTDLRTASSVGNESPYTTPSSKKKKLSRCFVFANLYFYFFENE